jgi:hypothetical protein
MKVSGTTPLITIGDADAEDSAVVFDGNAQDYYMGLDDTDDMFKIGLGNAVGTTPALLIDTSQNVTVENDCQIGDDLSLASDAAKLNFGADNDVSLTHVADTGILLNSTMAIQFNDSSQYIKASSAADLDIAATTDVNVDCTTLDVNAAMNVSGIATFQTGILPDANDGAYLGSAGTAFSDLFLAEGGVINWDSGDVTITQSGSLLTVAGGTVTATLTNSLECDAAGSGLSGTDYNGSAGVTNWQLSLNSLSAAAVAVDADSIAILDATDGSSKKESIADLATAMAGTGITATNGVFSTAAAAEPVARGDADVTLTEAFNYASATITDNRTWTLPASAGMDTGDVVSVKAATINATKRIRIAPAGSQTIDGVAADIFLDSSYSAVQLKYVAADTWMIF